MSKRFKKLLALSLVVSSCFMASPTMLYAATEPITVTFEQEKEDLKNIVILGTGGTIAGTGEAGKTTGYKAGELDVQSLIDGVPGLDDIANLAGIQVANTASDNITFSDWKALVTTINELDKDDSVDGFVITHGTDTLEETAFFLHMTAKTTKPIVVTGAMRPSTATSADGPMNLYQSVALAASDEAAGHGVMVVFSDAFYSARDVQKISTFQTDAFNSKDFGALGYMRDDTPYFFMQSTKPHTVDTEFDISDIDELPSVSIAYSHIDVDPDIVRYLGTISDGIILAGAGHGATSSINSAALREVQASGVPVIRSSRISNGVVGSSSLTPQKARILLQLALTQTDDVEEIQRIFETY